MINKTFINLSQIYNNIFVNSVQSAPPGFHNYWGVVVAYNAYNA